jgi:hypothetical protein
VILAAGKLVSAYLDMALDIATGPDTSGLLARLGLTDEHPLGWLVMGPCLRVAERGFCMIRGRRRPDGRCFVVAKTEAGARRWVEFLGVR